MVCQGLADGVASLWCLPGARKPHLSWLVGPPRNANGGATLRVEIEGLAKAYGSLQALEGVEVTVPAAGSLGVLGPEGSGKTTLTRILGGLEPATEGTIKLAGTPLADARRAGDVGYVPADPGLDASRTPRQLVRMGGRMHALETSERERRLERLLIDLRLEHLGAHAIEHLTTGHERRIALAYTLVHDPGLLVVDEPTRGLGPEASRRMREGLAAASEERTLVVASSDPRDVEATCEHVLGLEDGQTRVHASIDQLLGQGGLAIEIELAGDAPARALAELREHEAVVALRPSPQDAEADLEIWIEEPEAAADVLADLVDAGAPVTSFARRDPELGEIVSEHLEAPL